MLQSFTGDVEREIFGVDDTLDEVEVFRDQILAIIHDEDTADVKLDVVALLLGFKEIEGCATEENKSTFMTESNIRSPFGNEENRLEFELTLHGEVLDSEVLLPIVGQALVECTVFLWGDVGGVASPEGLGLVELLVGDFLLLDLLLLLILLLFVVLDLFNLSLRVVLHFLLIVLNLLRP